MSDMKLYVLYAGYINLPDKGHMTPGKDVGQPVSFPVYTYLIEHPKGLVLVDCGQEHGGPSVVREEDTPMARLEEIGYKPEDIKYVIMTHMHVDHAAFMTQFPNATFVIRKEELRAAWWSEFCEHGYVYDHYKDTRGYKFYEPLDEEDFDLFMDGKIVCIDTKGHTRGHQSVIVDLPESGKIVLVGDAAAFQENLDYRIQPGVCSNTWYAMQSLNKLDHLRDAGLTLFYGHDIPQAEELKLSPEYYE